MYTVFNIYIYTYLSSGTLFFFFFPLENLPALQCLCVFKEHACGTRKKHFQDCRDVQQTQGSTVFYQLQLYSSQFQCFTLKGSMWKDEESFLRSKGFNSCSFSV